MTFKELRQLSGMTQTAFARYFNIPRRTVQNWDLGQRTCPSYLLDLMYFKLSVDKGYEVGKDKDTNTDNTQSVKE